MHGGVSTILDPDPRPRVARRESIGAGFIGSHLAVVEGRQLLETPNPNPRRTGSQLSTNDFMGGEVSAVVVCILRCVDSLPSRAATLPNYLASRTALNDLVHHANSPSAEA